MKREKKYIPDLHTSLNAIGREWTGAIDVPLVEDSLLYLWIATKEVVERLYVRLRTVGRKREVMVLEVETNTGEIDDGFDTSLTEFLGVTWKIS